MPCPCILLTTRLHFGVWTLGWWLLKDAEVPSLASSCPSNYAKTSTNPEIAFQCFQASLLHVYKVKKSRKRNAIFFLFCLDLLGLMKNSFVESWWCNFHARTNPISNYLVSRWRKKSPWIQNIYFQWNTPALLPSWLVTFVWNKICIYMLSSSGRLVIRFWRPIM